MEASSIANTFRSKLVLLGDASVGKSCLVVRFATEEFYEFQEPTIGAAFMTQAVNVGDYTVKFDIWDTAGAERYRSLAPMYYRGAAAAIIVYDITSMESFEGAKSWVNELQTIHSPDILIALAGNKADLDSSRRVDAAIVRSFAESHNLIFMETSAKTGSNVKDIFYEIGRRVSKNKKLQQPNSPGNFQLAKEVKPPSSWCSC